MLRKRWITILVTVVIGVSLITSSALATETGASQIDPLQTTEQTPDGWDTDRNYYYKDGVPLKGYQKKKKKFYFFNKKTGKVAGAGFIKDGKNRYYCKGKGILATGYICIKGKPYYFKKSSATNAGKGFIVDGNKEYYCTGYGKLATGWMAIKYTNKKKETLRRGFYFYKTGKKAGFMAKDTIIGHLQIPKHGRLHEAYFYGIQTLNEKGWTLRAAYKYSYKTKYKGRWYRVSKKTRMKSEKYSLKGFKNRKGNCYVMNAQFYVMAKLLGYNVRQVYGRVGLPHSWLEIKQGGKTYVYDANFRNETGRNGFKIWYGKKGTWRYNKRGKLNDFVYKAK